MNSSAEPGGSSDFSFLQADPGPEFLDSLDEAIVTDHVADGTGDDDGEDASEVDQTLPVFWAPEERSPRRVSGTLFVLVSVYAISLTALLTWLFATGRVSY